MPMCIQQKSASGDLVSRQWAFYHLDIAIQAAETEGKKDELMSSQWVTLDNSYHIPGGHKAGFDVVDAKTGEVISPGDVTVDEIFNQPGDQIRMWRE